MPIFDITVVQDDVASGSEAMAGQLADSLGALLQASPGTAWVRLHALGGSGYAENGVDRADTPRPVFVEVTLADWPEPQARAAQAGAIAAAVARTLGKASERVHVEYRPPGRGRVAFGGRLLL